MSCRPIRPIEVRKSNEVSDLRYRTLSDNNKPFAVVWDCDTIGFHAVTFDTFEDASEFKTKLETRISPLVTGIGMFDFICLKCGGECYIGNNYCGGCGARLGKA